MEKVKWKKTVVLALIWGLTLIVMSYNGGYAKTQAASVGKMIYVVYDDSGSMVADFNSQTMKGENYKKRWSQAKYAMEVFCAMLGNDDVMKIYPMSLEGERGLTLNGSDSNRVAQVHAMNGEYLDTPFSTVTNAASDLKDESDGYEKWLVIITDGAFDDGKTSDQVVQEKLDSYNAAGIRTVYLGISDQASTFRADKNAGAYVYSAKDGDEVLSQVTQIANQIFEHQVLTGNNLKNENEQYSLSVDIPTDQIIVFAQGDKASVGKMTLNGKALQATATENVKYSDVKPTNSYYPDAVADKTLKGVVAIYEAGDNPYESGTFSVKVSGADQVEFYYRPGVRVNCAMSYNGAELSGNEELYAGDYQAHMNFVNPLTGEEVISELLSDVSFEMVLENNGQIQKVSATDGTFSLSEGEVALEVIARLPGNVELMDEKIYRVLPEPIILSAAKISGPDAYTQDQMGAKAEPIILQVTNAATGQVISEDEWYQTELTIQSTHGIRWDINQGKEIGTWEVVPVSEDGTIAGVKDGDLQMEVTATYQLDYQAAAGGGSIPLTIEPYGGSALEIVISQPKEAYIKSKLSSDDPGEAMLVTVRREDPETGQMVELTRQEWELISLKGDSQENAVWHLAKGDQVSTWYLLPACPWGGPMRMASGELTVTVNGTGEIGEYRYSGSGSQQVTIRKMTIGEWFGYYRKWIIVWVITAIMIIGNIKKKRLHLRGIKPACVHINKRSRRKTISEKKRVHRHWWTVVFPFKDETAEVDCSDPEYGCDFPNLKIVAHGRRSFKITNLGSDFENAKIGNKRYTEKDREALANAPYYFDNFKIECLDDYGRASGFFSFKAYEED